MGRRTVLKELIPERSTAKLTAKLLDENNNGIPAGSLTTLILTLYVAGYPAMIINNRDKQNVLNANGVAVDSQGNLAYEMTPADNQIIGSSMKESHIALFEWTWSGGAKEGRHEVLLTVENADLVP